MRRGIISGIRPGFPGLSRSQRQVAHVLLTRSPLTPKGPLDLHVLSTPPAFVLSQDQTLQQRMLKTNPAKTGRLATHQTVKQNPHHRQPDNPNRPPSHQKRGPNIWHSSSKHAVEFSRNERTPTQEPPGPRRAAHLVLLQDAYQHSPHQEPGLPTSSQPYRGTLTDPLPCSVSAASRLPTRSLQKKL